MHADKALLGPDLWLACTDWVFAPEERYFSHFSVAYYVHVRYSTTTFFDEASLTQVEHIGLECHIL